MSARNRTSIWIIVFLIFSTAAVEGQQEFAKVSLGAGGVSQLQAFMSKDTVLITFKERDNKWKMARILPDGTTQMVYREDIVDAELCGYQVDHGDEYFYFIERLKKNSVSLTTVHLNRTTKKREIVKQAVVFESPVVGVVNEDGVTVVTYTASNALELTRVSKGVVAGKESILVLSNLKATDFDVLRPGEGVGFYETYGRIQIYVSKPTVILCMKEGQNSTLAVTYDRNTGDKKICSVTASPGEDLKSFVVDSLVFSLATSKSKFVLSVHHRITGAVIATRELSLNPAMKDTKVYFHEARKHRRSMKENLWHTMKVSSMTNAAIVAQKTPLGSYSIVYGTTFNENTPGIVISPNPLAMVVGTILWSAARQARPRPGISRYLFATFDGHEIDTNKSDNAVSKRMDEYEIQHQRARYHFCGSLLVSQARAFVLMENYHEKKLVLINIAK
ncbi:MAG: hypothetical protein JSS79_15080 [Bacteroidetes bacterium]|nr:hypothetical protein [Bacteroidota bacterium]